MSLHILPIYVLVPALLVATLYDIRFYRIPNWLTFSGWVLGPLLHFVLSGTGGLATSLAGLGVAFALGMPLWLAGWMGAGDVKLITLVGGFLGYPVVFVALAAIALCGGLLSLAALFRRGLFFRALHRLRTSLDFTLATRQVVYVPPEEAEREVRLPYAVAISVGTLVAILVSS